MALLKPFLDAVISEKRLCCPRNSSNLIDTTFVVQNGGNYIQSPPKRQTRINLLSTFHSPPNQPCLRRRTKGAQQNILCCAPFCIGIVASLRCVWCGAPVECCQCGNVTNTNVASCQFVTPPLLEIGKCQPIIKRDTSLFTLYLSSPDFNLTLHQEN